jgi:hypothetical protein
LPRERLTALQSDHHLNSPATAPSCWKHRRSKAPPVDFRKVPRDEQLDHVDFVSLRTRLSQNGMQGKLTKQWIDRCLPKMGAPEVLAVAN